MHELSWWYLYIQILNTEAAKRQEVHDIIEALLPWINPELWAEAEKKKGSVRENVDFEQQLQSMLDSTWDTNPDADQQPFIDDVQVGGSEHVDLAKQLFDQQGDSPQQAPQAAGSIKDSLFPGTPPSFKGAVEGDLQEVADQFATQVPDQPIDTPDEPVTLRPMINRKPPKEEE